jgi:ATP-dependent Clp protease protease subunit
MSTAGWPAEIQNRMFSERAVSLFGYLDDARVGDAAAALWTLDALGDEPITVLFSCRGGSTLAALSLIDVFDVIGVEVRATCLGSLDGPPVGAFAAAQQRVIGPNARLVLRDDAVSFTGSASDLARAAHRLGDERHHLFEHIAESTRGRRSTGDVIMDFERNRSLNALEAIEYGLADEIAGPGHRILPPRREPPPLGFRPN